MNQAHTNTIRVLVADDHEMILDIARLFLNQQSDIEISTATSYQQAKDLVVKGEAFDVVLLDLNMPGMNGLEGLRDMIQLAAPAYVTLLTGTPSRALVNDAIEAGARGLISKAVPIKSLANSIRFIHSGEIYMPLSVMQEEPAAPQMPKGPLSAREMTVLGFLGEGHKNRSIADNLGLSEGTIKMHVMSICKKLEASNRTHAVIVARDMGLL